MVHDGALCRDCCLCLALRTPIAMYARNDDDDDDDHIYDI